MTHENTPQSCGCGCCGTDGKKGGMLIFLLAVGFIFFVVISSQTQQIQWVTDYEDGIRQAREQHKPLMLTFVSDTAQFCQDMRANTYPDKEVVRYVMEHFIPVLIDADQDKKLLDQYSKEVNNYYPSHVIKYADQAPSRTVFGYDTPQDFIRKLNDALQAVDTIISEQ